MESTRVIVVSNGAYWLACARSSLWQNALSACWFVNKVHLPSHMTSVNLPNSLCSLHPKSDIFQSFKHRLFAAAVYPVFPHLGWIQIKCLVKASPEHSQNPYQVIITYVTFRNWQLFNLCPPILNGPFRTHTHTRTFDGYRTIVLIQSYIEKWNGLSPVQPSGRCVFPWVRRLWQSWRIMSRILAPPFYGFCNIPSTNLPTALLLQWQLLLSSVSTASILVY